MNFQKKKPIRLKGKAYSEFRKQVFDRAEGLCEDCGRWVPLYTPLEHGFNVLACGHVAHIKSHGAGGGDTLDNVRWLCYECHILKEHGLKFSGGGD
jgi:5-methylcytosine-specific restriction endonuclease McrA